MEVSEKDEMSCTSSFKQNIDHMYSGPVVASDVAYL